MEAGHDHDFGHDHDHDFGHDHDHDHDLGHDHDHDHDVGHDHDLGHAHDHQHVEPPHQGVLSAVLTWFNIGRAPFMIVCEVLLVAFGVFGVAGTTALAEWDGMRGWPAIGFTMPVALIGAALTTKLVSGLFARYLPTFESKRVSSRSLVGLQAEVASEEVSAEGGRASVRDAQGDLYTIFCRLEAGSPSAKRGDRVVLVAYHADDDRYSVKPVVGKVEGRSSS
jgi:hypothetical protein